MIDNQLNNSAHRLKKTKQECKSKYNYNKQERDKHKDVKYDIKTTKCGERSKKM